MLFLDEAEVGRHLSYSVLIPAMREALISFSTGGVEQPVRRMSPSEDGFFGVMPAIGQSMGAKLVAFYPKNAKRGLPTHTALVALFEPESGQVLAVMEGGLITEMRTAAVSAVATEVLASPGAKVLAVLGSGVQAKSHCEALAHVRDFNEIRIWSRTESHAKALAAEVGGEVTPAEEAVRGADVVVTATSSRTPVLRGAWLKPGAHVNAVGACLRDWRELDDDVMRNVVFVDSREGAQNESGDVILSRAEIHAEIGELLAGARPSPATETTVFKSLGMAVEDVVAAQLVYDAATATRSPDAPGPA